MMVSARVELNDYSNRVINVIKARFGLNDKSEALNKFIDIYGEECVEKEILEEYVSKVLDIDRRHNQKPSKNKKTRKEFDKIFE